MCSTEKVGAGSSSGMATAIRVYPELRRVYPELRRVYPELRRVYPELRRVHPESRRVYPELRRACPESRRVYPELRSVYPELRRAPIFSRLLSHRELSHPAPFSTNSAKLNRQTPEIEHLANRRKQTLAICSNRQKINFCFDENLGLPASFLEGAIGAPSKRLNVFLPGLPRATFAKGSAPQTEIALTHSKQSIGAFLPGLPRATFAKGSRFAHFASPRPEELRRGTVQRDAHMRTVAPLRPLC